MSSGSWLVTVAGWTSIAAGGVVTLLGLLLLRELLFGGGSISGMWAILTMGAGPLLVLAGATIVVSGFKLMGGHAWAITVLETFYYVALCASIGWVAYSTSQHRHIHIGHVLEGALLLLVTGGPAIMMILLLRSQSLREAMTR